MRFFRAGIAVAALFGLIPAFSEADTDYRCLKDCVEAGKGQEACMSQCSYGYQPGSSPSSAQADPPASVNARSVKENPHNQFEAPVPANDLLLSPHHFESVQQSVDYPCMNLCLKKGRQYQLCRRQCLKSGNPSTRRDGQEAPETSYKE